MTERVRTSKGEALYMRLDSEKARKYYLNEARSQGWSVRVLERNVRYLREKQTDKEDSNR